MGYHSIPVTPGLDQLDPFATPPRAASPEVPVFEDAQESLETQASLKMHESAHDQEQLINMAASEVDTSTVSEVDAAASDMGTTTSERPRRSEVGTAASEAGIPVPQPLFHSYLRDYGAYSTSVPEDSPFAAAMRSQAHVSLPMAEPEEEQPSRQNQVAIDLCVAHLVEMGYGMRPGGDDGDEVESLRVYAQISGGNLMEAIELLEEEKQAWGSR